VLRAVADALTTLSDVKFPKDTDPRPGLIALLRSTPATAAPVVKEAAQAAGEVGRGPGAAVRARGGERRACAEARRARRSP
jgi:hypothetical protein